jgi:hypothetical protein
MAQTKTVIVEETQYVISSLTVGEVEDLILGGSEASIKQRAIENPRAVVLAGLNNALPSIPYTIDSVRKFSWKTFKALQEEILEFTGFPRPEVSMTETKPGESKATVN